MHYLHGVALAIHSVLGAGDGGAITPVQVELQAVVGLGQISTWNADTAPKGDFDWKRVGVGETGRTIKIKTCEKTGEKKVNWSDAVNFKDEDTKSPAFFVFVCIFLATSLLVAPLEKEISLARLH